MASKTCIKCNVVKTLDKSNFRLKRNKFEGVCNECKNEKRKLDRANNVNNCRVRTNENRRNAYVEEKDKFLERNKEYREENRDKINEHNKIYREANKEKINNQTAEWRAQIKVKRENGELEKPDVVEKLCAKCDTLKSVLEFSFDISGNNYDSRCKTCNRTISRENYEQQKDYINLRRENNRIDASYKKLLDKFNKT